MAHQPTVLELVRERLENERKPLLTTQQVAAWICVAPRTICLWAELGELPGFKVGRQWRFRETDIRAWLRQGKIPPG